MKEQLFIRDLLLELFRKARTEREKITLIKIFGSIAVKNYIGEFRFKLLEDFFNEYSRTHFSQDAEKIGPMQEGSIVHLITRSYETGGHSRFLENLVELDRKRTHHLIVLNQDIFPKRANLENKISKLGGEVVYIDQDDPITKGKQVLKFLMKHSGRILLHHHPEDFLPSLILPSIKGKLELILFNHSDHSFSFGFELADKVINIREEAHRMTVHWRKVKNSFVLPLPIIKPTSASQQIHEIRKKYKLEDHQHLGLCIGSPHKFQRTSSHYFFGIMQKALDQNPDLVVMVVGLDEQSAKRHSTDYLPHERLHLLGILPDPTELQMIASIAIDPMPFGSYTALLETCFYGAFPLVCFDTLPLFDLYQDPSFQGHYVLSKHENDYLEKLQKSLRNHNDLETKATIQSINDFHCGAKWLEHFEKIIQNDQNAESCPDPITEHKLDRLNQSNDYIRNSFLSEMYTNCKYFSTINILRAVFSLSLRPYNKKDLLGILKKKITHSVRKT